VVTLLSLFPNFQLSSHAVTLPGACPRFVSSGNPTKVPSSYSLRGRVFQHSPGAALFALIVRRRIEGIPLEILPAPVGTLTAALAFPLRIAACVFTVAAQFRLVHVARNRDFEAVTTSAAGVSARHFPNPPPGLSRVFSLTRECRRTEIRLYSQAADFFLSRPGISPPKFRPRARVF